MQQKVSVVWGFLKATCCGLSKETPPLSDGWGGGCGGWCQEWKGTTCLTASWSSLSVVSTFWNVLIFTASLFWLFLYFETWGCFMLIRNEWKKALYTLYILCTFNDFSQITVAKIRLLMSRQTLKSNFDCFHHRSLDLEVKLEHFWAYNHAY